MNEVRIELNFNNINKAEEKLQNYMSELKIAVNNGLKEFSNRFYAKLIENATLYGITDPYILGGITIVNKNNGIVVMVHSEQVAYVEYGVGIIGSQNPHPKKPIGWEYDINHHGNSGWVYPVITNMDYSFNDKQIISKDGNVLAWTKGHEPRPFIYNTWLWGARSITNIINKHIRRIKID